MLIQLLTQTETNPNHLWAGQRSLGRYLPLFSV